MPAPKIFLAINLDLGVTLTEHFECTALRWFASLIHNKLLNLNKAHCNAGLPNLPCIILPDQPRLTEAGIYLGVKGERSAPATGATISDNEISGFKMAANCVIAAPTLAPDQNVTSNNKCNDQ